MKEARITDHGQPHSKAPARQPVPFWESLRLLEGTRIGATRAARTGTRQLLRARGAAPKSWRESVRTRAAAALLLAMPLLISAASAAPVRAQPAPEPISLDKLLEISSVVGGETPRWSPDGSRILFSSGLTGGLMTVDAEGKFPVRVPVDPGGAGHFLARQEPRWSPDGEWISFISDKAGNPELWLFSLRTGEERRLTDLGGRINAYDWAPDGRAIALSGNRFGNYDIWVVTIPDGRVRRLTSDERYEVFPSWLPDGNQLLYVRLDEDWVDHEVLEIPASGGESRLIVRDSDFFDYQAGGRFGSPLPSPDGERVLFRSHRSGWINYWTVPRAGGGDPRPIAVEEADQSHARWSPDGSRIAYISNHDGTHELRVIAADGGEPLVVTASEGLGSAGAPEWSPDGRWLSYTFETPTRPRDLYVVSADGGEPRRLTRSVPEGGLVERLVEPRKVRYPSTDGFEISAYLYVPPGAERTGERYPGIMWIHGGPRVSSMTTSSSTSSSSPSEATSCCSPTSAGVPATERHSRTPTIAAGGAATWRTCGLASSFCTASPM